MDQGRSRTRIAVWHERDAIMKTITTNPGGRLSADPDPGQRHLRHPRRHQGAPRGLPGCHRDAAHRACLPYGALGAQLLGYVGSISARSSKVHQGQGYIPSDVIGKDGAEEVFESELRGSPHYESSRSTAGRIVHVLQNRPAAAGNDVQLTMDVNIQQEAETALSQGIAEVRTTQDTTTHKNYLAPGGAAVVLDARDGSVVAMASSPSYPVNQFTSGIPPALFKLYSSPSAATRS